MHPNYIVTSTLPQSQPPQGIQNQGGIDFDSISRRKQELQAQEYLLLEKALSSNDPQSLIKAHKFMDSLIEREKSNSKSLLINPFRWDDSEGYKRKRFRIVPKTLREMGKTPIIKAIIGTRQAQVSSFSSPQANKYDTGFIIRRKRKFYSSDNVQEQSGDGEKIQSLTNFILNGGLDENKWHADSFDSFLKKITKDSLELDQACFELVPSKGGELVEYFAVDGGTMYFADTHNDFREERVVGKKAIKGYYPSYVQVIEEQIMAEYYPWELCFGIRNESTDIESNGYGSSEIEQLMRIITWMLYSDTYNGKFFSQGSSPKGILKVNNGVNRNRLAEFRQSWQSMVAGVDNAWKIPVIESDTMEWLDLQKNNTDMQFAQWQEYLIKVACAIFKIAPEEVGFNLGNASQSNPLFESNNEASLKYSKDKGLKPLLKSIQSWINKYIISRLDPEFEFIFVGLELETEEKELELDIKKVGSFMGYKEIRRKHNLPDDFEEGDFPLNSQFIQMYGQQQQAQMFGEQQQENTEQVEEGDDYWSSLGAGGDSFWEDLGNEASEPEKFVKANLKLLPKDYQNPMMAQALEMLT